jgi:dTDP-4-dehydrorhamnose reductase
VARLETAADATCVSALDHAALDVADPDAVSRLFDDLEDGPPDVLVNAAAFTAVDRCESEWEHALAVNGAGPGHLAELCAKTGTRLVHVSTDYVFDGEATTPYAETVALAPRSAYGRSKAEGERRVLATLPSAIVVRTSWVFGPGRNFVGAILRQAILRRSGAAEGPLQVVDDQLGCPTYAADLAEGLLALARAAERSDAVRGVYHLANAGAITWWDFARQILDTCGFADLRIERIKSDALDLPAPRPRYSVLDCGRAEALGVRLRGWQAALAAFLETAEGHALRDAAR